MVLMKPPAVMEDEDESDEADDTMTTAVDAGEATIADTTMAD
jgi:hypothetical protein